METGTWLGIGALLVSAAGALNSMRKTQVEDRSGAVNELKVVVGELREENKRLKAEMREGEEECRRQIADVHEQLRIEQEKRRTLQGMFNDQAQRIGELERQLRETK